MTLPIAWSCLDHLPCFIFFVSQGETPALCQTQPCIKQWVYLYQRFSLSFLTCCLVGFWSLWAAVVLRRWLMSVLAGFQTQLYHFSCCSRPVTVVTVAPSSAVREDYWTGSEWCKRLAGKHCGWALAYWDLPTELNRIVRCLGDKHRWNSCYWISHGIKIII